MELWTCIFILSNITSSTHSPPRTNIKPKEKEGVKWKRKRNKSQKIARKRGNRQESTVVLRIASLTRLRLRSKDVKGERR